MTNVTHGAHLLDTTRQAWLRSRFMAIGVVMTLLLWHLVTRSSDSMLHAFGVSETLGAGRRLLANQRFWEGLLASLKRLGGGLAIAAGFGIPVGLLVGFFRAGHEMTYVPFQFLRMISPLSWTPVAIILLGIGSGPVYFLVAIAAVWPIILNTAAGVNAAEPRWIEAARCLGAGDFQILRYVLGRASLPHILVGLQLALGVAWIVLVPAEMLGVASGLGYMILDFRDVNDYSSIMALIIAIGFVGLALDLPHRLAVRWASWL